LLMSVVRTLEYTVPFTTFGTWRIVEEAPTAVLWDDANRKARATQSGSQPPWRVCGRPWALTDAVEEGILIWRRVCIIS